MRTRQIINGDLSKWAEAEIRSELGLQVAQLNRLLRTPGLMRDTRVGDLFVAEERARLLGNEIRRRYGRPLL